MTTIPTYRCLAEHAAEIRRLGRRVVGDVIEIGRLLTECKRICGHGNWMPWLEREFGWTDKTAERFMSVHALAGKFDNLSNLELPLSGLYLLAAPSTPQEARDEIVDRAQAGEQVPITEIKRIITIVAKSRQPVKAKPPPDRRIVREPLTAKPKPRADIGPASAGEIARKLARLEELERENHRLQCENVALRSEIEDLRPRLAMPPPPAPTDDGLDIPACLRRGVP